MNNAKQYVSSCGLVIYPRFSSLAAVFNQKWLKWVFCQAKLNAGLIKSERELVLSVIELVLFVSKVILSGFKLVLFASKVVLSVIELVLFVPKVVLLGSELVLFVSKVVLLGFELVLFVSKIVLLGFKLVLLVTKLVLSDMNFVMEMAKNRHLAIKCPRIGQINPQDGKVAEMKAIIESKIKLPLRPSRGERVGVRWVAGGELSKPLTPALSPLGGAREQLFLGDCVR